jgi:hypothetical protein
MSGTDTSVLSVVVVCRLDSLETTTVLTGVGVGESVTLDPFG